MTDVKSLLEQIGKPGRIIYEPLKASMGTSIVTVYEPNTGEAGAIVEPGIKVEPGNRIEDLTSGNSSKVRSVEERKMGQASITYIHLEQPISVQNLNVNQIFGGEANKLDQVLNQFENSHIFMNIRSALPSGIDELLKQLSVSSISKTDKEEIHGKFSEVKNECKKPNPDIGSIKRSLAWLHEKFVQYPEIQVGIPLLINLLSGHS